MAGGAPERRNRATAAIRDVAYLEGSGRTAYMRRFQESAPPRTYEICRPRWPPPQLPTIPTVEGGKSVCLRSSAWLVSNGLLNP